MAGGRFELAMEPTAIGLVSLNSNSEMHMAAISDFKFYNFIQNATTNANTTLATDSMECSRVRGRTLYKRFYLN